MDNDGDPALPAILATAAQMDVLTDETLFSTIPSINTGVDCRLGAAELVAELLGLGPE